MFCCAGSDAKVRACRELGAEAAFDYQTQDVAAELRKVAPAGVNVWWETPREPDFDRAVAALAARGRMILMAGRGPPALPGGALLRQRLFPPRFRHVHGHPEEQRTAARDLNRWLAGGQFKPRIDRTLPLAEAAEAHRLQEQSTVRKTGELAGKIVLKP